MKRYGLAAELSGYNGPWKFEAELSELEKMGLMYFAEKKMQLKKIGRPKKATKYDSIDGRRAETIRMLIVYWKAKHNKTLSQRSAIKIAAFAETQMEPPMPGEELCFSSISPRSLEQSVSRGKKLLEINPDWSGGVFAHLDKK